MKRCSQVIPSSFRSLHVGFPDQPLPESQFLRNRAQQLLYSVNTFGCGQCIFGGGDNKANYISATGDRAPAAHSGKHDQNAAEAAREMDYLKFEQASMHEESSTCRRTTA
jgi:hypothetical protein